MAIYKQFDVVIVPFPFTDRATTKKRPVLILNDTQVMNNDKSVMAMITTKIKAILALYSAAINSVTS